MKGTGALTVVALSLYDPKSLPPSLFPFVQSYIRRSSLADDRLFPCISSRQLPELHESVRHAESPQCTRHDAKARLEAQPGRSVSRPPPRFVRSVFPPCLALFGCSSRYLLPSTSSVPSTRTMWTHVGTRVCLSPPCRHDIKISVLLLPSSRSPFFLCCFPHTMSTPHHARDPAQIVFHLPPLFVLHLSSPGLELRPCGSSSAERDEMEESSLLALFGTRDGRAVEGKLGLEDCLDRGSRGL